MRRFSLFGVLFVSLLTLGGTMAQAQTPDGLTPAVETVCDPLKANGITPGLYGLCVAFCEAQDWDTRLSLPPADREPLDLDPPSGRILANYNKKKTATDPDMPCYLSDDENPEEATCPCYTAEELDTIDGEIPQFNFDGNFACTDIGAPPGGNQILLWEEATDETHIHEATSLELPDREVYQCAYYNNEPFPVIQRTASFAKGTLTVEQSRVCNELLRERVIETYLMPCGE